MLNLLDVIFAAWILAGLVYVWIVFFVWGGVL